MSWELPREYISDDRDIEANRLQIFMGGNGDWYVSVIREGDRIGPAVRVTTSGTPRGFEKVPVLVARIYQELPVIPTPTSKRAPRGRPAVHQDYAKLSIPELWALVRQEGRHIASVMSPGEIDQAVSVIRRCKAELAKRGDWKPNGFVG